MVCTLPTGKAGSQLAGCRTDLAAGQPAQQRQTAAHATFLSNKVAKVLMACRRRTFGAATRKRRWQTTAWMLVPSRTAVTMMAAAWRSHDHDMAACQEGTLRALPRLIRRTRLPRLSIGCRKKAEPWLQQWRCNRARPHLAVSTLWLIPNSTPNGGLRVHTCARLAPHS